MAQQLADEQENRRKPQWIIGLGHLRAFSGLSILPWCGKRGNQAYLRLHTSSLWYSGIALNRSSSFGVVIVATVLWNHFSETYKAHGSPGCSACGFLSIDTRVFQMLHVRHAQIAFGAEQDIWQSLGSEGLVAPLFFRRLWSLTSCSKAVSPWPSKPNRLGVCAAMHTWRRTTDSGRRCPSTSGVLIPAAWDDLVKGLFWMCYPLVN